MSKLITNTIRHTGASSDNLTLTSDGKLVGLNQASPTVGDGCDTSLHIHSTLSSGQRGAALHLTTNSSGAAAGDGSRIAQVDGDLMITNHENAGVYIGSNGTNRITVAGGGDVTVNTGDLIFGTAGKGIVLGSTSNTAANTLDDYEEGTYNPTWAGITNFGSGYNDWYYTKIGRVVNVLGTLRVNTTTNDGTDVSFTLPFTPKAQSGNTLNISVGTTMHNNVETGSNGLVTYVYGGNAYGYFYNNVEDGSWWILEGQHLSADDTIYVNFTYLT